MWNSLANVPYYAIWSQLGVWMAPSRAIQRAASANLIVTVASIPTCCARGIAKNHSCPATKAIEANELSIQAVQRSILGERMCTLDPYQLTHHNSPIDALARLSS